MEWVECGAAALGIVLGFYGKVVPLEELRVACGISRDGSKAINIVRAARGYGLGARGIKAEVDALRSVPVPAILHWSFRHFVVLEGISGNKVFLNDPRVGPRVETYEELARAFTGVALTFTPGPDFQPGGRKPSLVSALWQRLSGLRAMVLLVLTATLLLAIPGLLLPFLTRHFVDSVLIPEQSGQLAPLLVAMATVGASTMALTWWQRSLLLQLENRISIRESRAFIRHLLRLPVSFYLQRSAGEVASRVAINDRLARLLSGDLARSGLSLILVCVYLAVMVWYDPVLALIGAIIAALNFLVLRFVARARRDAYRRLLEAQGKLTGSAMAAVHSIDSIKASGTESDFFARLAGQHTHANNTEQELGVFTEVLGTAPLLLAGVSSAVVLAVGGLQVMEGHLSVGTLVGFQVLLASFLAPVAQLVSTGSQLQELEAATNRLDDALRHHVDPELASVDHARTIGWDSAHRKPRLRGHVQMQHISFGYSQMDPPTIIDLNLDIEPGRKVAIIGATGSGKSTIARLLVGLYQPWEGEILFDGQPRAGIPREVLNSSVALVDQDIVLFHGTVRDNLTLWDRSIPDTDIVRAARDACIHGDITARPGGYELVIEEGGRNLSGGQAQRLEIARALVRNPAVLVLDEATSALDALTEHDVMTNVIHRGCTCIIVAHRLSTIRDCDEIIVLESGRPVQRGTHEDMTKDDGPYTRLIRSGSLDNGNTSSEALLGTSG